MLCMIQICRKIKAKQFRFFLDLNFDRPKLRYDQTQVYVDIMPRWHVCPSVSLTFVCPPVCPSVHLSICPSVILSIQVKTNGSRSFLPLPSVCLFVHQSVQLCPFDRRSIGTYLLPSNQWWVFLLFEHWTRGAGEASSKRCRPRKKTSSFEQRFVQRKGLRLNC